MKVRLLVPTSQVEASIDAAVEQGTNLLTQDSSADAPTLFAGYESWDKRNQLILDSSFDVQGVFTTSPKSDYVSIVGLKMPFGAAPSEGLTVELIQGEIETKIRRLKSLKGNLDLYPYVDMKPAPANAKPNGSDADADGDLSTIFIIHGRDVSARLEVQNLLLKATHHPPIILMEQPNRGATIIEKIDEHLGENAGFAVVLLTGDDRGGLAGDGELLPRARQNVILELGYAMGKLGRRNVTLLHEEGVELPSDILGVAYYPLDAGGAWKARLIGDLKAANFDVNLESLLG